VFDFDKLREDFERQERKIDEFTRRFAAHPSVVVSYEDLCSDYAATLERVQRFLGLEAVELRPGTNRRATPRLRAAIANYDDLKTRFAGTRWAWYFDEG
jgi:Tfp pilus assembly protein PilO